MNIFKKVASRFGFIISTLLFILLTATPLFADVVTEWNTEALDYFEEAKMSNQFANRALAMVHIAF